MPPSWHPGGSQLHSAQPLQQRLNQNLNHRDVLAIRVMHQLAQRQGVSVILVPVVSISALGLGQDNSFVRRNLLESVWGISQTPQVWLDHQAHKSEGELCFDWDFAAALPPAGQVERQFKRYYILLNQITEDENSRYLPFAMLAPPVKRAEQDIEHTSCVCSEHFQLRIATDENTVGLICDVFREVVGKSVTSVRNFFEAGATLLNPV